MRGVKVGSGWVVMPGALGGVGDATTPAGRGAGVGVLAAWGCSGTGVGAGRLIVGTGVGGGAACARAENTVATAITASAQTPNAARRTGGRYIFAICEMRHVSAGLSST